MCVCVYLYIYIHVVYIFLLKNFVQYRCVSKSSRIWTPARRPAGRMNMFVTECSKPMATNMEMGNQAPIILPVMSFAMVQSHTATQNSQLHITPLTNVGPKSEEHFLGRNEVTYNVPS